jgi:hypothetical protein
LSTIVINPGPLYPTDQEAPEKDRGCCREKQEKSSLNTTPNIPKVVNCGVLGTESGAGVV